MVNGLLFIRIYLVKWTCHAPQYRFWISYPWFLHFILSIIIILILIIFIFFNDLFLTRRAYPFLIFESLNVPNFYVGTFGLFHWSLRNILYNSIVNIAFIILLLAPNVRCDLSEGSFARNILLGSIGTCKWYFSSIVNDCQRWPFIISNARI